MTLGELIGKLEQYPEDQIVPMGFSYPHSYRGVYNELAFEPRENCTVGSMLEDAKEALGSTYTGWKGGEFRMKEDTAVNLAYEGSCGEEIGEVLLNYMLGEYNV